VHVRRASGSTGTTRFASNTKLAAARVALPAARPAVNTPLSSARQPASTGRPAASSPRGTHTAQLPVIRTITTIINVVPLPVRILLSLMALLALALAAHSRLAGVRARRLDRQRGQLLEDVGLLQGTLLPVPPAALGAVGTSVAYRPSDGLAAGGDFYDLFALANGQVAVVLGDLSGHGRQALPHTALVRYTVRAYLEAGMSPRNALQRAAPILERQLGESLATVVAATYDPHDRTLVYSCAGHPPPVVIGSRARVPVTAGSSPPIGAALPTGMRQTTLSLPGRASVCFYTDGVVEARVANELVGVERLQRALAELGPTATASALLDRIAAESDARPDDMAACLLQVRGDGAEPITLMEELELDSLDAAGERSERFLAACGIPEAAVAEVMSAAHARIARDGSVVLQVRFDDGAPRVTLTHRELSALPGSALQTA
jgi:serine phosphatase RsbU (regulator of sigma subunit)